MGAASAPPCQPGQICSKQFGTKVEGQNLYFATSTNIKPDGTGTTTLNYWNGTEWKPSATSEAGKPWTPTADSPLSNAAKLSLKSGDLGKNASAKTSETLDKAGVPKTTKDNAVPGSKNQASDTGEQDQTSGASPEDASAFGEEKGTAKEGTRTAYTNVRYPLNLSSEHQDCIKFSILEYRPSLASGNENAQGDVSRLVEVKDGVPQIGKKPLGTITLPIPAGINDSNSVSWQEDTMNVLQEQFGSIAQGAISGGVKGAEPKVEGAQRSFSEMVNDPNTARGISGMIAGLAVNSQKFQQRSTGTIFNNNLELLFNGPSLRSFSFNFKLSPREPAEARAIMQIIRFFKQAMAVKRSKSTLLLKTPHTFAISYLTSNKQHPYLNKFKECALTSFNVDYTPEGQYMTYMSSDISDRSMISYNISLSFQELEPVFDDEYKNEPPDQIQNIGY